MAEMEMTPKEIAEVLSKAVFQKNDGDATNLEYRNSFAQQRWEDWIMPLWATLQVIFDGAIVRIRPEPKVRPYEAKDWLQFLNKVWLNKENEPMIVLGYTNLSLFCSGNCSKWASGTRFFGYDWAFDNLTDPNGHPFGEIESDNTEL